VTAEDAFSRVRRARLPVWLDAAGDADGLGRFSYVACDPVEVIRSRLGEGDAFGSVAEAARGRFAVGFFGYDLGRTLEPVPERLPPDAAVPDAAWAIFDAVWRFEHETRRGEVLSVDAGAAERLRRALDQPPAMVEPVRTAPLRPDTDFSTYERMVQRALEYILAGDIYQVNLAHRLRASLAGDPFALYLRMRAASAAPLGAFLDFGDVRILSTSPELFLAFEAAERRLETRPIKGTRPRGASVEEDERLSREVRDDEKERAEHVMIVDLMRNDLGRVAEIGSVRVESLHRVVPLATVHHAVSTISCRVRGDAGLAEILRATFPGGSITGAPKVRAMQIIEELEACRRGPYTGAIGIILPDGSFRLSIAIRTAVAVAGEVRFHAGGGIVADSTPDAEWRETWAKAQGFAHALDESR
jgi:para-aminobenzoate synthetase component I